MKLQDAQDLANELMTKHSLFNQPLPWKFEFDNAVRRFGCCKHRSKRITLSKKLVELNDEAQVKDTILHEIAHALVGPKHGHDRVWKQKALEIGCNGERCYSSETVTQPEPKYKAICPNPKCGHVHKRNRRPKRESSCGVCGDGRFDREKLLIFK
jgi:predicted SprT family Zn-dependent metalloprotease